jgi:hypothetical protein
VAASYESGTFGKGSSLGDMEFITPLAPIEAGNRVWNDVNQNGKQDGGEPGLANVIIELYNAAGTVLLGTSTTDASGNYYFTNANVSGGLQPNTNYILRISTTQFTGGAGTGALINLALSPKNVVGNGAPGLSDNDAASVAGKAEISFTTGGYGQNNFNLDFGLIGNPLPVSLVSFTAQLGSDKMAKLDWTTATELNTSHFIVQKSKDGINYTDIGRVNANGNSSSLLKYSLPDNLKTETAGLIYYRLCSVDIDGKTSISAVRTLRISNSGANTNLSIIAYPNPSVNELHVTIPAEWQNKNVLIEVVAANGNIVYRNQMTGSSQTTEINVSTFSRGVYMVRVSCEGTASIQKIIKQ